MTTRQRFSWRPRHTVVAAMVVVDALLVLFLVGAFSYTELQEKVLGDQARLACTEQLAREVGGFGFDYRLDHVRYGGPNTLEAGYTWHGERYDDGSHGPPLGRESGTVRCRMTTTGDDMSDPLTPIAIEVDR